MRSKWLVLAAVLATSAAHAKSAKPAKAEKSATPETAKPGDAAPAAEAEAEPELTPEEQELLAMPKIVGPATVDLGHEATLELPEGFILFEKAEATKILEKGGNDATGVAAVFTKLDASWLGIVEVNDDGYVTDDDANELDAGELLESYKQGTIQQNARRRALGVSELYVDAWSEKPHYDRATHVLTWGIAAHDKDGKVINFDTRTLGRNGYLAVGVIDAPEAMATARAEAAPVIAKTTFRAGSRYQDHQDGDRSSGVGLRGLVLGTVGVAVAKKAGLLVVLLAFLKKAGVFIAAGAAGFWKWITGRKSE